MIDPVIGYHVGQRVAAIGNKGVTEFEGVIEAVVVPERGHRFIVVRDDQGRAHHRWFQEVEMIEGPASTVAVKVNGGSVRTGSWADLLAERGRHGTAQAQTGN